MLRCGGNCRNRDLMGLKTRIGAQDDSPRRIPQERRPSPEFYDTFIDEVCRMFAAPQIGIFKQSPPHR